MPEQRISRNRSMDTVRRPLCGCFVLSCMAGGIFRKPWVFGDASRLHDLKRPSLFRRDKVPSTKHQQTVRLRLYTLKEVFGGSKGRFFKNAPWQGVGQRPTKGEGEPAIGARLFRRDKDTQGREGGYYTFSFSQRSLSGFTTAE